MTAVGSGSSDGAAEKMQPVTTTQAAANIPTTIVDGDHVLLVDHRMAQLWLPNGGHVEPGEHPRDTVVRELKEEIGLAVSGPGALTPLFKLPAGPGTGWEFVWVYRLESAGPFELHPQEIERGEWWLVDDVTREIAAKPREFAGAFRHIWSLVEHDLS